MEDIPLGVTKPRRAYLAPGGLIDRMAWKTIRPGIYSGYWESYKSEIAAYELDKLLGLEMIPPTVERRVKGDLGAAVMWVSPIKSFKDLGGPPSAPAAKLAAWSRQLIRAKMFDNLICNIDPNLGNWLVDPVLEPHPDRSHPLVHDEEGHGAPVDAYRSGAMGSYEGADR